MGPARTYPWIRGVLSLAPGVAREYHGHGGHEIHLCAVAATNATGIVQNDLGRSWYYAKLHQVS